MFSKKATVDPPFLTYVLTSTSFCVRPRTKSLLEVAGVDVGGRVDGGLLDSTGRNESVEDGDGTGLVVGTRGTSTTEGLLANDGTSALVVKVHHTRSVAEQVAGTDESVSVSREDGTGKSVLGGGVDELASLLELFVGVSVDGDDGTEDLVDHGNRLGVLGLDNGGLNVPTLRVVTLTTAKDLTAFLLGSLDETHDLLERVLGDDGTHEVLELLDRTNRDGSDLVKQLLLELTLPHGLGNIEARESRALLTLVLESGTDGLGDGSVNVGRLVNHVEILTTGLTDDTGVASVLVKVVTNLLPEVTEDVGRASEVKTGKLAVVDGSTDDLLSGTGNELDDTSGETSLEQDLVSDVVGVDRHGRRLPNNDVTSHSGSADKVTSGDGKEVKGRDSKHEALERTVLGSVPGVGRALRGLRRVELLDVLGAEAVEIAKLGSSVNLGLPDVLTLTKHGSSENLVAVLVGNEVSCLEEDGSTVVPGHVLPSGLGLEGALDGLLNKRLVSLVVVAEDVSVIGRVGLLGNLAGLDLVAIDDDGHLERTSGDHLVDGLLELDTVITLGLVVAHRLILDGWQREEAELRRLRNASHFDICVGGSGKIGRGR